MSALVTIGIPCFNSARWLGAAIESALGQTWPEIEVIVADDGSTDSSPQIARGFADRVRALATEHRGANHARNLILRESRGQWLQFLDADDYLLPEKIESQLAPPFPEGADLLYSAAISENAATGERELMEIDESSDVYARWISWQLPQTGGALWRREALARIGGWNEEMPCCQEHELYLRALQAGLRFEQCGTPGAIYRIWSEETLCRRDPSLVVDVRTKLIDEMLRWLREGQRIGPRHEAAAGRAFFEMARTLAKEDLERAAEYHRDRRAHAMMRVEGPAAPLRYRVAYRLLGFTGAEKIARLFR